MTDLRGKVYVITGASAGIGKETARELAKRGGTVVMACRNLEKAYAAKDDIIQTSGNFDVTVEKLDVSSLQSVRDFAETIDHKLPRIDCLINNAGMLSENRRETEDGLEVTMATNHLGHFLLTNLLLKKLKSSAPCRVVVVASEAQQFAAVDFDDFQSERNFKSFTTYARTKTANILFGRELHKRLQGTGVDVHILHPGAVVTEIGRENDCFKNCLCFIRCCVCCLTCECYLYCSKNQVADTKLRPYSTSDALQVKLWDLSAQLTKLEFDDAGL